MRRKRTLTLLEVMIAILVIAIVGGSVLWKVGERVADKRFQSSIEVLRERVFAMRKLAEATRGDFQGVLQKQNKYVFDAYFEGALDKRFRRLEIEGIALWNGEEVKDLSFDFFSNGKVEPTGELIFRYKERLEKINFNR